MNLYFSDSQLPENQTKSIFLGGPSPRNGQSDSWRKEAISILETMNFDGDVFIPCPEFLFNMDKIPDFSGYNYDDQVQWEVDARKRSDIIIYWLDRNIDEGFLGLTTNFEIGDDYSHLKFLYGRPDKADKNRYIDQRVLSVGKEIHNSLHSLMLSACLELGDGAYREGGEVSIPLKIWRTTQFQQWYKDLKQAGNSLTSADVLYNYVLRGKTVFSYVLKVKIWVEKEKRHKGNEIIISRRDVGCILAKYKNKIILVKEFRSPVSNSEGFVYELPGGSSFDDIDSLENVKTEFFEEVGIMINDKNRFNYIESRQLAATVLTHKAELYFIELNENEFNEIVDISKRKANFSSINDDDENTYVEIVDINEVSSLPIDFSVMGMIFACLSKFN